MAIDRLDAPLRMTWTLRSGVLSGQRLEHLARRIGAAGVFFVTLRGDFCRDSATSRIVDILRSFGIAPILLLPLPPSPVIDLPPNVAVHLDLTDLLLQKGGSVASDVETWVKRVDGALSMVPLRPLLPRIPEILALAGRLGLPLHLPNVPLVDDPKRYSGLVPAAADLPSLADLLGDEDRSGWPEKVIAHDLFVWELLYPGRSWDHYIGCQAGNSIAHLDAAGTLHPCISWPSPLGSLLDEDLQTIWTRQGRLTVLDRLAKTPEGCQGCEQLPRCHGGCRGLVQTLAEEKESPDLLCAGPGGWKRTS